mmetsp:Transcript_35723/g.76266  ORF Transcript_35723/g.76266 Transcript_35723/m.76266 type:complete len:139 (-) Transcript_35723:226-642(-)
MKPAWDQLGGEYEGSNSVVVADVDCTKEQALCSKHGVKGYPTIKYYKDGDKEGKPYQGGRDFDALKKFTADTLEVQCDIADQEGCSDREKKYIAKMQGKDAAARGKQLARLTKMKAGKMKAELKAWLNSRINILKQLE